MILLWIWIGLLLAGLASYLIVLRIHQKKRPFRIKLTWLFLLFVLLPTLPLTWLNVQLLTQSARVMLLPGLDTSMNQAMETIRKQSELPGQLFFKAFPDFSHWNEEALDKYNIECTAVYSLKNNFIHHCLSEYSSLFGQCSVRPDVIQQALNQHADSRFINMKNQYGLLVFHQPNDSLFYIAGYVLDESIGLAKEQLSQSINMYNTMSLLKENILQKNLVMILAFVLLFTLVLLSVLIAGRISKSVNEPIDQLVRGMERVRAGNLNDKITAKSKGEFGFLIESFNQMTTDLKDSHEKLVISEKLAAWREVARRMSHEIKNSLTPITFSLRHIRERLLENTEDLETQQSIYVLEDEFNHLKSLAETFSTFAKMPKPVMAEMSINDTIQHVVKLVEPVYPSIQFQKDLDESIPFIAGDYEQMKRVFLNLIQNGADAIKAKGKLHIKTELLKGSPYQVQCEIKDSGEGMDKETLASIFRPYFTTKGKGTGLGMPIVKQILDDHEASIEVLSQKGVGTQVVLKLR